MNQYIDKSALLAEIEKRMQELRPTNTHQMQVGEKMDRDVLMWLNALTWVKKILETLEVKEGDFKPIDDDFERDAVNFCFDNGLNTTPRIAKTIAKHFFELGLKAQKGE